MCGSCKVGSYTLRGSNSSKLLALEPILQLARTLLCLTGNVPSLN